MDFSDLQMILREISQKVEQYETGDLMQIVSIKNSYQDLEKSMAAMDT